MTFADAIRSIIKSHRLLLLTAAGSTAQLNENKVSEVKDPKAPRDFESEAVEVEQILVRVARLLEVRMKALEWPSRFNNPADTRHPLRSATRTVVLEEEGKPAVEVAWLYGITERRVEQIRGEAGRKTDDGERAVVETPLTAPARDALKGMSQ